ncbi:MAG: ferrous iron transport protein B [Actinomycetaceae bacterium]|nr:ferrous iron transport protein B [Actinomycetaceae bacterium]MDY5273320.1 ferrous iron transport protein B [Arcanobacterium sp.]
MSVVGSHDKAVAMLEQPEDVDVSADKSKPTILLLGNTNVGKSTLFNAVTGARQAIVNAPGTTVEVMAGTWKSLGVRVLDLPGTYSLIPTSPDEAVVARTISQAPGALTDAQKGGRIDLVLAQLDGSALTRSLYLLAQIGQTGHPVAVLISMADVAKRNGTEIDPAALSKVLGVPVLIFDPRKPKQYSLLDSFVRQALDVRPHLKGIEPDPGAPGYSAQAAAHWRSQVSCASSDTDQRDLLAQTMCACNKDLAPGEDCPDMDASDRSGEAARTGAADVEAGAPTAEASPCHCGAPRPSSLDISDVYIGFGKKTAGSATHSESAGNVAASQMASAAGEAAAGESAAEMAAAAGEADMPVVVAEAEIADTDAQGQRDPHSEQELKRAATIFTWVEQVEKRAEKRSSDPRRLSYSDKVDRLLLNPIIGPVIFLALMWVLFKLAGEWVGPIQDFFDGLFTSTDEGAISGANGVLWLLGVVHLDGTWLESFLVGGLMTGLGVVASFVPLMFTIFVAISILEDSGYMARAAFLADRLMRKIGLDGRVVLPLIMGFGCNLPSLAAARALPSARQRLVTALVTPLTSCAARLTIYLMIAKIFFPRNAGTVVFAMYVTSVVLVTFAAWVLKFFITKSEAQAPLMLVLPAYHVPRVLVLLKTAGQRSWTFVKGAGKIIVVMTIAVWLLGAIPMGAGGHGHSFGDPELPMEDSAYGQVAKVLEPVFAPAGFNDWHMTGALMTGFVAKETVVSSIVVSYNMDESAAGDAEDGGDDLGELPQLLTGSFEATAGARYAGLAALAFLVFVLAYTPCLATVGEQVRLIGGKLTLIAVSAQLVGAWILAVAVFQIGKLIVG